MAYVLLPPAGGVLLLITEHKSDYVRLVAPRWKLSISRSCLEADSSGLADSTRGSRRCCLRS